MQGLWTRAALASAGWSSRRIGAALRDHTLTRVAPGWYADRAADPSVAVAITHGCRVGCLSAAALHGLWTPPSNVRHWVVSGHGRSKPPPAGVVVHRGTSAMPAPVQPLVDALWLIVQKHDAETALIVLESAARHEAVPRSELLNMIDLAPVRSRPTLGHFCDRSDSGTETRVRLFYQRRAVRVRAQAQVPGVGRVDLLVGDSQIVECDSTAHHTAREQYLNDRSRDLGALVGGYRSVRLSWEQVFLEWPATQQALSAQLRRRAHRSKPADWEAVWLPQVRSRGWLAS